MSTSAERLDFIDGCRGLAIFVVLLFHAFVWAHVGFCQGLQHWLAFVGRAGVDLFLVLSGFCLTWPLVSRPPGTLRVLDPRVFARRRIERIVPPYYFAIVIAVGASGFVYFLSSTMPPALLVDQFIPLRGNSSWMDLLSHILLIHGLTSFSHSIDGAFWSLSLEWQFYLLFPLLIGLARKRGLMVAFALTLALTLGFRLAVRIYDSSLVWSSLFNESAPARWCEFGAGMLLADFTARGFRIRTPLADGAFLASLVFTSLVFCLKSMFCLLPIFCGCTGALLIFAAAHQGSYARRILVMKPLCRLGEISYSVYLLHGSVFMVLTTLLYRLDAPPAVRMLLLLGPGIALSLAVGRLSFSRLERPFMFRRERSNSRDSGAVIPIELVQ